MGLMSKLVGGGNPRPNPVQAQQGGLAGKLSQLRGLGQIPQQQPQPMVAQPQPYKFGGFSQLQGLGQPQQPQGFGMDAPVGGMQPPPQSAMQPQQPMQRPMPIKNSRLGNVGGAFGRWF